MSTKMNRNVLFGIALFVVVFMYYVSYSTAADNTQLIWAIENLTNSVNTLNSKIETLNKRIGTWNRTGTLTSEIDDLGKDIVSLESEVEDLAYTIRNQ